MTRTARRASAELSGRERRPTLNHRLLLHLASRRRRSDGPLSAGFTLVELMIVIVIVGILSAVAIPNFLNQTRKAKFTEAKSNMAATIKQAQAQFLEDGRVYITNADMMTYYKTPEDGTTKFNYEADFEGNPVYVLIATPNGTDTSLDAGTDVIEGCVNFETGFVDIQTVPEDAAPNCAGA